MTLEDFALRFEGLSDEQIAAVHRLLEEAPHTIANLRSIVAIIEADLPRLKRTLATLQSALATINANQQRYR